MKNLFYKFGKILSEGKGRQLLWLSVLIAVVLTVLFLFLRSSLERNDVLALFFGVDSLSEGRDGVFVKLLVSILGTLLFSTFLISVITNIFDNFSGSFKEGRLEVNPRHHTLFLGANHMLIGMLRELSTKDLKKPIVILTTSNIEELREKLFSTFSSKAFKILREKVVLVYGERDNAGSLDSVNAWYAEDIYVLGEDDEINHDGKSLSSVKCLKERKAGDFKVRCKVFLEDSYSVFSQILNNEDNTPGKQLFCVDCIDIYDDIAERVLKESAPVVDMMSGRHVHLVVSGHGRMAWSFVKAAFSMLHFPNFDEKTLKNRTTITIVDDRAGRFMKEFMSLYANIFLLSNVRYEFMENGERKVESHHPSEEYGDFLDMEWEFIEGDIRDMDIQARLASWAEDDTQQLFVSACDMEEAKNIGVALSLPRSLYEHLSIPIFAYLPSGSVVLDTFGKGVFGENGTGRITSFGKDSDSDVLFESRSAMAMRTHYVYKAFEKPAGGIEKPMIRGIEDEWYTLPERFKLSNYYYAAAIPIKERSFGLSLTDPIDRQLSQEACALLDQVEHRRWVASDLLLGYYPPSVELKKTDSSQLKKRFIHRDIVPWAELISSEKKKDTNLRMIPYIVSGDINLLIKQMGDDADAAESCGEHHDADHLRQNMQRIRLQSSSSTNPYLQ